MFLVVFVTLALSIVGLFAQVVSIQSTKIYSAQTTLADTMAAWHAAAAQQMVQAVTAGTPPSNIGGASGCRMTATVSTSQTEGSNQVAPPSLCQGVGAVSAANLPKGYATAAYSFYTVAYQAIPFTGAPPTNYVITYASATNPATGGLMLPDATGPDSGYSISDLLNQLGRTSRTGLTYGTVQSLGILSTQSKTAGAFSYNIPTSIPVGSVAIVSLAN